MAKDETNKKKYEAPIIVPLGELAVAIGQQTCSVGTGAAGACTNGSQANPGQGGCSTGAQGIPCHMGSQGLS